jgi:hypothetical protein
MNKVKHCRATDARDKIYALLPIPQLFEMGTHIRPDYSLSLAEVFTGFAANLMARSIYYVLGACQGRSDIQRLPSWVPDWTLPPKRARITERLHMSSETFKLSLRTENPEESPQTVGSPASVLRVFGVIMGISPKSDALSSLVTVHSLWRSGEV